LFIFDALDQLDVFTAFCTCRSLILPLNLHITLLFGSACVLCYLMIVLINNQFYETFDYLNRGHIFIAVKKYFWFICGSSENNLKKRVSVLKFYSLVEHSLVGLFYLVTSIIKNNIIQTKNTNIGFVFFLFLHILVLNFIGLYPYTFTVTSSFVITLFFSLTVFLAANIMGLYRNGFSLFANFLPSGTPLFIAPLLILIEIISYFSRIFSLSIRLFANMLSGHGLLKILIGFSFVALRGGDG